MALEELYRSFPCLLSCKTSTGFQSQILLECGTSTQFKSLPDIMIPLSKPFLPPTSVPYLQEVLQSGKLVGQGRWTQLCTKWLENMMLEGKAFLVTSGTTALEMAAMVVDICPGDEVIFPSFTFVSTVNAFVARGAVPVFVDIEDKTMNIDVSKIHAAITPRTRAIVPVHYAGISCAMDEIMDLASFHNLVVIEDAAQSLSSKYHGKFSGTIGHIGCFSFHETKNLTSGGQGGAILINQRELVDRAEVVYDNGTNRVKFLRGEIQQYEWKDVGSNYVLSECLAALLWSQLELSDVIQKRRREIWHKYHAQLQEIALATGAFDVPSLPPGCESNGHIYC
jgi:dTDP-4-amino-4,6-dideoxygalactose transaminase